MLARFLKDKSGGTAIEYCMIAAGISIVIVTAAGRIGQQIYSKFYGPLGGAFN